ncbi:probable alpha,alpha-trehalose-phosphate synthase [UDP-forming] 9 [Macadamia integrifolia]|uniref:probable alpha,alpha-trehalose-phosphate synthase [UDP-forming] 9 n=1 Tax=Macadamia integrifolia TaxID=60698 RepID=UPI001C4F2CD9|nr:probable alpha,alpha-trehalose-phosphate synthase [UDP-forming] 9 [Macadamia integrifolia]
MFSRSCANLLNLVSTGEDFPHIKRTRNRLPRVMTVPGIISDFDDDDDEGRSDCGVSDVVSSVSQERRIVVANQLPLKYQRDLETKKWCFEWDKEALVLQLKDGFSADVEVVYVGCLKVEIDVSEQEEVAQLLLDKFRCVPTFLPSDIQNKFYHGFCKQHLWPLFHYMLPISPNHGARFDRALWQAYVSANKIFADKVIEVINPDEDSVWVHDYHLMVLPTFLRKHYHRVKLGFFLHSPFPSSEIYRTLPVRDEILRSLLNSDLIGFHTFDYARHFLSCCSRMLGLDYESKRGYIGLEYYGRTVSIKILPVGVHMGQLESVLSLSETAKKAQELKERFEGKIVILGVDDMDMFKGISFKFLAMGQLLEQHPELKGKVVLIQIANPARTRGKDIEEVQEETHLIAKSINEKYGRPGYEPIVFVNGYVPTFEKAACYAISECCVVNAVRDGMNLVPYEYTVCRQGSPVLDEALCIDGSNTRRKSMIVVSEFIGCSPSLSGAIRVNPWNIDAVSEAMNLAITMPEAEKQMRHEKHYKYVSSHDVAYWSRSFDQDLERACREHFLRRCWGIGFGLGFRVVALGPNFRKLSVEHIAPAYRRTNSRVILLDYDGTMMPQASVDKTPSNEVISVLNSLCSDPKNIVFIVSGRGKDSLSRWFSPCEKLGIAAEHGYFTRWSRDSEWESPLLATDFDWIKIAEPVMELYTETTDGSYIEHKESALVWHHQEADPDFGSCQAKELLDHLESVLANEPVLVKRGQHIVEVKPQGVSKGIVVENLISTMLNRGKPQPPDFVLCIGDDRSDEDMFESVARSVSNPSLPATAEVFACTVGQKPSKAKYYLDDTVDVIKLLQGIAAVAVQPSKPAHFQVSFEGSL